MQYNGDTSTTVSSNHSGASSSTTSYTSSDEEDLLLVVDNSDMVPEGPPPPSLRPRTRAGTTTTNGGGQRLSKNMFNQDDDSSSSGSEDDDDVDNNDNGQFNINFTSSQQQKQKPLSSYVDPTTTNDELVARELHHQHHGDNNHVVEEDEEECVDDIRDVEENDALSLHFFQRRRRVMGDGPATFEEKDGRPATRGEAGMLNNEDDFADYAMRVDYDSDLDDSSSSSSAVPSHHHHHRQDQSTIGSTNDDDPDDDGHNISNYNNNDEDGEEQPASPRCGMHQSRMWSELLLLNTENGQPLDQSVHCLHASKYVSDYVAIPTSAGEDGGGGEKATMQMRVLTTPFLPSNAHLPYSSEAQVAGALEDPDDEDHPQFSTTRRPLSATKTPSLSLCTQERLLQLISRKLQRIGENPFSSTTITSSSSPTPTQKSSTLLSHFIFSGAAIDDDYRLIAQYEDDGTASTTTTTTTTATPASASTISLGAVISMSSVHRHRTTLFAPGEAARASLPSAVLSLGGSSSVVPSTMTAQEAVSVVYLLASSLSSQSTSSGGGEYIPHGNMTPSTIRLSVVPSEEDNNGEVGYEEEVKIVLDDPLHYGFHYPFSGSSVPCANTNVSHVPVNYLEYLNQHVILPTLLAEKKEDEKVDGMTLQQELFMRYEELQNSMLQQEENKDSTTTKDSTTGVAARPLLGGGGGGGYKATELDDVHALLDVLFQCIVGHSWFHGQSLMDVCRELHSAGSSDAWVESVWSVIDSILNTIAFARATPTLHNFKKSSFQQQLPLPRMDVVKDVFRQVILDGTITTIKELLAHPIFECIGGHNNNNNNNFEEEVMEMAQFNVAGVVSRSVLECRGFLLQGCMNGGGGGQINNPVAIKDINPNNGDDYDDQQQQPLNEEQSPLDILTAKGPSYCLRHPMLPPLVANITNRLSSHTLHRLHTAHLYCKRKNQQAANKDQAASMQSNHQHQGDQIRRALKMLTSPLGNSDEDDVVAVWCRPTIQHALYLLKQQSHTNTTTTMSDNNSKDVDNDDNDPITYLENVAQCVCRGTGLVAVGTSSPTTTTTSFPSMITIDHTTSTITIAGQHQSLQQKEAEEYHHHRHNHSQCIEINAVRLGVVSYLFYMRDLFSTVRSAMELSDTDIEEVHRNVLLEHNNNNNNINNLHHHQQADRKHGTTITTAMRASSHDTVHLPEGSHSRDGNVEFDEDDVETERNKALVKALMRKSKVSSSSSLAAEEVADASSKAEMNGERESSPPVNNPSTSTTLPATIKAVRQRLLSYVQWASYQPPPPVPSNLLVTNTNSLLLNVTTNFHTITACDVSNSRLLLGVTSSSTSNDNNYSTGEGHMSSPLIGVCHLTNIMDCDLVAVASRQLVLHGNMTNTLVSTLLVDNPICVGKATFQQQQHHHDDDDDHHQFSSSSHPQLSFLAGEALLCDVQFIPYCVTFQGLSLVITTANTDTNKGVSGGGGGGGGPPSTSMGVMLPEYVSSALSFPVQGSRRLPYQRMLTDVTIDESAVMDISPGVVMKCLPRLPGSRAALLAHYDAAVEPSPTTTNKPVSTSSNPFINMLTACLIPPTEENSSNVFGETSSSFSAYYALPDAFLLPITTTLSSGPYLYGNNNTASITILPGEITPGCSGVVIHNIHGGLVLHSSSRLEQQRRRNKRRERRIARRRVKLMGGGGGGGGAGGGGLGFCAPSANTDVGGILSPPSRKISIDAGTNEWGVGSASQQRKTPGANGMDMVGGYGYGVGECDPADAIAEGLIAALHGVSVAELYDLGSQSKSPKAGCSGSDGSKNGGGSSYTSPGVFADKGMINFLDMPCDTNAAGDKDEQPDSSTPTTDTDDENDLGSGGKSTRGSMQRRGSIQVSVANSAVTDFDDGLDDDLSGDCDDDDDEDSGGFWGTDGGGLLQRQNQSVIEPPLVNNDTHNTITSAGSNSGGSGQSLRGARRKSSGTSLRGAGGLPSRRSTKTGKISKSTSQQHLLEQQQQLVHLKRKDIYSYSTPSIVILEAVPYVLVENVSRATIVICGVGAGGVTIRACSHCTVYIVSMGGAVTIEGGHHLDIHAYVMGPRNEADTTMTSPSSSSSSAPIIFKMGRVCTLGDITAALNTNNMTTSQRRGGRGSIVIPDGIKLPSATMANNNNNTACFGEGNDDGMGTLSSSSAFPTNIRVFPLLLEAPQLETIILDAMMSSSSASSHKTHNDDDHHNNDDLLGSFLHDYTNRVVVCPQPPFRGVVGSSMGEDEDEKPFDHLDNDISMAANAPQCIYQLVVPYLLTPTSVTDYFLQQHDIGILEELERGTSTTTTSHQRRTEDLPKKPISYVVDTATEERLQRYMSGKRGVINLRDEQGGGSHTTGGGGSLSRRGGDGSIQSAFGGTGGAGSMNGFSIDYPLIPPTFSASTSPTNGTTPQDLKNGAALPLHVDKYRLSGFGGFGDEDAVRVGSEDDERSSRRLTPPFLKPAVPSLYLPFHVLPQQTITICNLSDCSILRMGATGLSPIVSPPPFAMTPNGTTDADDTTVTAAQQQQLSRNNAQPSSNSSMAEFNPIIPFLGGGDDDNMGGGGMPPPHKRTKTDEDQHQQQQQPSQPVVTTTQRLVISNIAGGVIHIGAAVETLIVSNCVGPLDIVVTAAKTVVMENCTGITLQCACFEIAVFSCTFCHLALHANCAPRIFNSVDVSEAAVLLPQRSQFAPIAAPTFDFDGSGRIGSGSASVGHLPEASSTTIPNYSGAGSPLAISGRGGGGGSGGGRSVTVEGNSSNNRFSALHIACVGLAPMLEELGIDVDVNLYDEGVWTSSSSPSNNYFRYSINGDDASPHDNNGIPLPPITSRKREQRGQNYRNTHYEEDDEEDCVSYAAGLIRDGCPIHRRGQNNNECEGRVCTMYCISALLTATVSEQRYTQEAVMNKRRADLRTTISALDFPMWLRPLLLTLSASPLSSSSSVPVAAPLLPLASLHLCAYLMTQLLSDFPHWVIAPPLHCTVVGDDTTTTHDDDDTYNDHHQYYDDGAMGGSALRPPTFLARRVYYEVGSGLYEAVGGSSSAMNFDPHATTSSILLRHNSNQSTADSPNLIPQSSSRRFSSGIAKSSKEEEEVQRIVDDVLAGGSIFLSRSDISSTLMELTQSTIQQTTQQQRSVSGGGGGVGGTSMATPPSGAHRRSPFGADGDDKYGGESSDSDDSIGSSMSCTSMSLSRRRRSEYNNTTNSDRMMSGGRRDTLRDAVYEQLPRVKALIKFIALIRVVVDVCEEEVSTSVGSIDRQDIIGDADRTPRRLLSVTDMVHATLKSNWKSIVSVAQEVEAMIEEPVDELNIIRLRLWALEQRFSPSSASPSFTSESSSSLLPARSLVQLLVDQDAKDSHQKQLKKAADRLLKFSVDAESREEKAAAAKAAAASSNAVVPKVVPVVTSPTTATTSPPPQVTTPTTNTNRYGGGNVTSSISSPTTITVVSSPQMMDDIESASSGGSDSDEFAPMTPLNAVIAAAVAARDARDGIGTVAAREAAAVAVSSSAVSSSALHDDDDVVVDDGEGEYDDERIPTTTTTTTTNIVVDSGNNEVNEGSEGDSIITSPLKKRISVRRPRRAPVVDSDGSSPSSPSSPSLSSGDLPMVATGPNTHPHHHRPSSLVLGIEVDDHHDDDDDAPLPRSPNGNLSKTFGPDTDSVPSAPNDDEKDDDGGGEEEEVPNTTTTSSSSEEGRHGDDDKDDVDTNNNVEPHWAIMTLPNTIPTATIESIHSQFEANKARMRELADEERVVLQRMVTWRSNKKTTHQ